MPDPGTPGEGRAAGNYAALRLIVSLWLVLLVILGRVALQVYIDWGVERLRGDQLGEEIVEHLALAIQQAWILIVALALLPPGAGGLLGGLRGLVCFVLTAMLLSGYPGGELQYLPGFQSLKGWLGWLTIVLLSLGMVYLDRAAMVSRRFYFRASPVTLFSVTACAVLVSGAALTMVSMGVEARRIYVSMESLPGPWDLLQTWLHQRPNDRAGVEVTSLLLPDPDGPSKSSRPSLVIPPGSQEALFEVRAERDSRLQFNYGIDETSVEAAMQLPEPGDLRVEFRVLLNGEELFEDRLDPREDRDRRWQEEEIDLSSRDGEILRLQFQVEARWPADLLRAGFGRPRLVKTQRVPRREGAAVRPNIVVISVDSLRADHLGTYGYQRPTSPNLDRIALQATVFENAIAPSSMTQASIASLLTGLDPISHGVIADAHSFLADSVLTLPEWLQMQGITTGGWTTNPMLSRRRNYSQGFEVWREFQGGAASLVTQEFLDFVRRHREWQFFAFLHLADARPPHNPPPGGRERFTKDDDLSLNDRLLERAEALAAGEVERRMSPAELAHFSALYDAEIRMVDDAIGRVQQILQQESLWGRTIVVVTSPHGEELQEHGGLLSGGSLYQEQVRVPLILRLPGKAGRRIEPPVPLAGLMEMLTCLLEDPVQGALLPPWPGGSEPVFSYTAVELPAADAEAPRSVRFLAAVRDGPHKLIRGSDGTLELYDLVTDPGERKNLAQEQAGLAHELKRRLGEWARQARGKAVIPVLDRVDSWTIELQHVASERAREAELVPSGKAN